VDCVVTRAILRVRALRGPGRAPMSAHRAKEEFQPPSLALGLLGARCHRWLWLRGVLDLRTHGGVDCAGSPRIGAGSWKEIIGLSEMERDNVIRRFARRFPWLLKGKFGEGMCWWVVLFRPALILLIPSDKVFWMPSLATGSSPGRDNGPIRCNYRLNSIRYAIYKPKDSLIRNWFPFLTNNGSNFFLPFSLGAALYIACLISCQIGSIRFKSSEFEGQVRLDKADRIIAALCPIAKSCIKTVSGNPLKYARSMTSQWHCAIPSPKWPSALGRALKSSPISWPWWSGGTWAGCTGDDMLGWPSCSCTFYVVYRRPWTTRPSREPSSSRPYRIEPFPGPISVS